MGGKSWREIAWIAVSLINLGLGALGAVLPLLPTTPFLLLAAASATRGSPRLAHWIDTHPRFGPLLNDWRTHGALTVRTKVTAIAVILAGWAYSAYRIDSPLLLTLLSAVLVGVAAFLLTRPAPPRDRADA